jgi:hypothetical protein
MTTIISHENNAHPGYPNHQAGNQPPGYPNYHGSHAPPGQQTYHGSHAPPGQPNYYGIHASPGQMYYGSHAGYKIYEIKQASIIVTAVSLLSFIGWVTYTLGVGLIIERVRVKLLSSSNLNLDLDSDLNPALNFNPASNLLRDLIKVGISCVYHAVYYAIVNFGFASVALIPRLASYRFAVIAFLAVGSSFLASDIISIMKLVSILNQFYSLSGAAFSGAVNQEVAAALSELNAVLAGSFLLTLAWTGMIFNLSRSASTRK